MIEMYKELRKPGVEKSLAGSGREDEVSRRSAKTDKDSGIYPVEEQDRHVSHSC